MKGVVFVDMSPDGIEWMDTARQNGWDEEKMLQYLQQDLASISCTNHPNSSHSLVSQTVS